MVAESVSPSALGSLTDRERQCLRLVARGYTAKEIAAALGIADNTVNVRCESAMRKLGASGRRHAARLLAEAETLQPIPADIRGDGRPPPVRDPGRSEQVPAPIPLKSADPSPAPPSESVGSETIGLGASPQIEAFSLPYEAGQDGTGAAIEMREAGYGYSFPPKPWRWFRLPLRRNGERHNDLTPFMSLLWAPVITLLIVVAVRIAIGTLDLLSDPHRASGAAVANLMQHSN